MQVKGIGEVKAIKLKSLAELAIRFSRSVAKQGLNVRQPGTIAEYYMEKLRHRQKECVWLVCLDAKGQILDERMISEGSVNLSVIYPRDLFIVALKASAVNVILIHNHPSGDASPSQFDVDVTMQVAKMGKELGIPLLDHVIIGDHTYFSFLNEGLLA